MAGLSNWCVGLWGEWGGQNDVDAIIFCFELGRLDVGDVGLGPVIGRAFIDWLAFVGDAVGFVRVFLSTYLLAIVGVLVATPA